MEGYLAVKKEEHALQKHLQDPHRPRAEQTGPDTKGMLLESLCMGFKGRQSRSVRTQVRIGVTSGGGD